MQLVQDHRLNLGAPITQYLSLEELDLALRRPYSDGKPQGRRSPEIFKACAYYYCEATFDSSIGAFFI